MNRLEHQSSSFREMSELARKRESLANSIRSTAKADKLSQLRHEAIISMNLNHLLSNLPESYTYIIALITEEREMSTLIAFKLWNMLRNQQHSLFEFRGLSRFKQILIITFLLKTLSNQATQIFSLLFIDVLATKSSDYCGQSFIPFIIMLKYSQTNFISQAPFLMMQAQSQRISLHELRFYELCVLKLEQRAFIADLKLDRSMKRICDHLAYLYYNNAEKIRFIDVLNLFLRKAKSLCISSIFNMKKLFRTLNQSIFSNTTSSQNYLFVSKNLQLVHVLLSKDEYVPLDTELFLNIHNRLTTSNFSYSILKKLTEIYVDTIINCQIDKTISFIHLHKDQFLHNIHFIFDYFSQNRQILLLCINFLKILFHELKQQPNNPFKMEKTLQANLFFQLNPQHQQKIYQTSESKVL